jgi:hypothetical protein
MFWKIIKIASTVAKIVTIAVEAIKEIANILNTSKKSFA